MEDLLYRLSDLSGIVLDQFHQVKNSRLFNGSSEFNNFVSNIAVRIDADGGTNDPFVCLLCINGHVVGSPGFKGGTNYIVHFRSTVVAFGVADEERTFSGCAF